MKEVKPKKPLLPVMASFILGVMITFLVMNLIQSRNEIKNLRDQLTQAEKPVEKIKAEGKHWMDEMIEKRTKETEQRIKDQQAQGDDLKNQFEQFVD